MRSKAYIFNLWLATLMVLSATVLSHHHHLETICLVEQRCDIDGRINDSHTSHHAAERSDAATDHCEFEHFKHVLTVGHGRVLPSLSDAAQQHSPALPAALCPIPLQESTADGMPTLCRAIRLLSCFVAAGGWRAPPLT